METLTRLLSAPAIMLVNLALIISAVSTLDSALSSAAKLAVVDMRLVRPTVWNGRAAMVTFMAVGLGLLFLGNQGLFAAVAISGTASMFLAPVVIFCVWGRIPIPAWSYVTAFSLAMAGALVYFADSSGHVLVFAWLYGPMHEYTKLLIISLVVMAGGCCAFAVGAVVARRRLHKELVGTTEGRAGAPEPQHEARSLTAK